jgi:cytoskeletal protein RodZ
MPFVKDNWKSLVVVLVILLVAGFIIYQNHTIAKQQEKILAFQLAQGDSLRADVFKIINQRKDTVKYYNNTIKYLEKENTNEEIQVANTADIDSLIDLYFLHRAKLWNENIKN